MPVVHFNTGRNPSFPIYNLRATFASRLSAAGASDVFVAQMMGHTTPSILQTYAKAVDEHRREAIRRLEALGESKAPARTDPEVLDRIM